MTALMATGISASLAGQPVLRGVTFAASGGSFVGLVGPNGAGKSTLLRALANILPYGGEVLVDGRKLAGLPQREIGRTIAYLAQGDVAHWPLSVRTVVGLGRAPHAGPLSRLSVKDAAAIDRAIALTGIAALADRDITAVSGGERARALLARALAVEAPILLADEPVGALDPQHGLGIMQLLKDEADRGRLVIAVLHDLALASRFCDRLLVLRDGALAADGNPHDVLAAGSIEYLYDVSGHHGAHDKERFVIPWRIVGR